MKRNNKIRKIKHMRTASMIICLLGLCGMIGTAGSFDYANLSLANAIVMLGIFCFVFIGGYLFARYYDEKLERTINLIVAKRRQKERSIVVYPKHNIA